MAWTLTSLGGPPFFYKKQEVNNRTNKAVRFRIFFKNTIFKVSKIRFYFIFVLSLNEVLYMRIDQYLWCIRLFKSRNLASTSCKKGMVKINGQKAKASREVMPLDRIEVRKDQLWRSFEVLDLPKSRMGAKLVPLYVIEKTDPSLFEHQKLQNLSSNFQREDGTGRPTKKDRRDLDELEIGEIDEQKEDL